MLERKGSYIIKNTALNRVYIGYASVSYMVSFLTHYLTIHNRASKLDSGFTEFLIDRETKFSIIPNSENEQEGVQALMGMYKEAGFEVETSEIIEPSVTCEYELKKAYYYVLKQVTKYMKQVGVKHPLVAKLHLRIFGDVLLTTRASAVVRSEHEYFAIEKFTIDEIQRHLRKLYKSYLKEVRVWEMQVV